MRNTVYSGVLALSLFVPAMASAQTAAAPAPAAPASEELVVLRPAQLLAIGTGLVVGALVFQAVLPSRLGVIAGAVLGGYLGDLWYSGRSLELHVAGPKT